MKKGWVIGCGLGALLSVGLCGGLVALWCGGIFALTRPVVDASEEFLELLGQEKLSEAYAATSEGYQARQDEATFTTVVKHLNLTEYSSVSWQKREIKNQEGTTEGTVTTKSGDKRSVAIQLAKEGGKWKVAGVNYRGYELMTAKTPSSVPPDAELKRMVTGTLLSFNQAVKTKDFAAFYGEISNVWKKETTPEKLRMIFQEFISQEIDIEPVKNAEMKLSSPPEVNGEDILVIAGRFPTEPFRVRFGMKFVNEHGDWKLISLSVNVGGKDMPE